MYVGVESGIVCTSRVDLSSTHVQPHGASHAFGGGGEFLLVRLMRDEIRGIADSISNGVGRVHKVRPQFRERVERVAHTKSWLIWPWVEPKVQTWCAYNRWLLCTELIVYAYSITCTCIVFMWFSYPLMNGANLNGCVYCCRAWSVYTRRRFGCIKPFLVIVTVRSVE